jgi:hypothetical protein
MTRLKTLLLVLTFAALPALAEDRYTPIAPMPVGNQLLTLPTSHIPAAGTWEVIFSHRFNQSIDEGDAVHSFLGLDGGANVTLGASYTPFRDFEVSLVRSNILDTLELAGKYVVIQQSRAIPVSAALRGGFDFRTEEDVEDSSSVFAQAIVSHQFGQRAVVFAVPTFVTNAGRANDNNVSVAQFENAFNVPFGASYQITRRLSLVGEIIPPNRDLPQGLESDLGWAAGIKSVVGGHFFEVLLTNSNGTTVDQYATSTFQGVPLKTGDLQLGFNIVRRWGKR